MTATRTVHIPLRDDVTLEVELFAEFDYAVDGQTFRFLVTLDINNMGFGKCITHKASGKRVCALGVGVAYLPAYAHLGSDDARAKVALDEIVALKGAARVRSVLAAAEPAKEG